MIPAPDKKLFKEADNLSGFSQLTQEEQDFCDCLSTFVMEHGQLHGLKPSQTCSCLGVMYRMCKFYMHELSQLKKKGKKL